VEPEDDEAERFHVGRGGPGVRDAIDLCSGAI
jgi:hypothetical protein